MLRIVMDPAKCDGCRVCEVVCSLINEGESNPVKSRIRVVRNVELVATFPGGGIPATPEIVAQCQKVWQELNKKVDIDEIEPDEIAREYLVEHGLVRG